MGSTQNASDSVRDAVDALDSFHSSEGHKVADAQSMSMHRVHDPILRISVNTQAMRGSIR